MTPGSPSWIFGYGSLVWRPAFAYAERRVGALDGFARRFWQGSTDHRGAPGAPGRVVTLVEEPGAVCWGVAFRVAEELCEDVLEALDRRESGGFARRRVEVRLREAGGARVPALVYVAAPGNPNFLGPAPAPEIAAQVLRSHGPSGSNREYVLRLEAALEELGAYDDHVGEIARLVRDAGAG